MICTNRNQIATRASRPRSPSVSLPSACFYGPLSKPHTNTHTHSQFCSNHHRKPCSQTVLSKHSWGYTIEVFLFNLSDLQLPNPHQKKGNSTEPQLCKNLIFVQETFVWNVPHLPGTLALLSLDGFISISQTGFCFLASWSPSAASGFHHSNVNSVFAPHPFRPRRGPSLWCLKVGISPKRLWQPG